MTNNSVTIPFETLYILYQLRQLNFDAYLVGGAVRDILLNSIKKDEEEKQQITDFDFTTNTHPEKIQAIFAETFYTNEFGTVGIAYENLLEELANKEYLIPEKNIKSEFLLNQKPKHRLITPEDINKVHPSLEKQLEKLNLYQKQTKKNPPPFEVTTYRSEDDYEDFRRPSNLEWGETLDEDLERRDFTINAMALTVKDEVLKKIFAQQSLEPEYQLNGEDYQIIDLHSGLKDLAAKRVRTVRSPDERFTEDALRMLRAVRFAAQLDMEIDDVTFAAIKQHADLIKKISWERIRDELLKMLVTKEVKKAFLLLFETGLLELILPELIQGRGVDQGGHHATDVWTHSLDAVASCPSCDPIVKLATLLHDVGKPDTYEVKQGNITFYNHEIVSSRIASKIGKRLKLSRIEQQRLFDLVRYHMFHYQPHQSDAAVRRMIKRIGLENINDMLAVREGDRVGSGSRETSWRLEELKDRIIEQLNQPFDVTDLAIDGNDLMQELGLKPGPILGTILNELTEMVLDEPELNEKGKLLEETRKIVQRLT